MEKCILIVALFTIYFHIGGLATTNILRLTKGNKADVNYPHCLCDNCGYKIPPFLQFPVISYVITKGKCKNCGIQIPKFPLLLEITVMIGMFLITVISGFSVYGVLLSFAYYEGIRVLVVKKLGKREDEYEKQYKKAVVSMIPFVLCAMFVIFLYGIV